MHTEYTRSFMLHVPAKQLFGPRTERTATFEFPLPRGNDIVRDASREGHGAEVIACSLNGLQQVGLSFEPIANGVKITWTLKNDDSFPVVGRSATITVRLKGTSNTDGPREPSFSDKYMAIRKRFFEDFYYEGLVADKIDRSTKYIKFADQTTYMGQSLIFLASEANIRNRLGHDASGSLSAIRRILAAIDELDLNAESYFGGRPSLDGFVARDDIRGPGDSRLRDRWKLVESDGDGRNPDNTAPSGDQVFGLMNGLWFVVHFADDEESAKHAKEISQRLFDYVRRCRFRLMRPSGDSGSWVPVARGDDMRWLSSLLHGLNKAITGRDQFDDCQFDPIAGSQGVRAVASFWDNVGSEAADLMALRVNNPLDGKLVSLTFRAHIVLMALAVSDVWSKQEFENAALAVNHHLSVLVYCLAHKCKPDRFYFEDLFLIMDRCPDSGPRGDLPVGSGWQRDNRWVRSSEIDQPQGDSFEYFGVDFLMLHNLAVQVFL